MTAHALDEAIFSNDEWRVSAEGMEHVHADYFIPAEALAQRRGDGLWLWPLQMAEKTWCEPRSFVEAFLAALRSAGHQADAGLEASLTAFGWSHVPDAVAIRLGDAAARIVRGSKAAAGEMRSPGRSTARAARLGCAADEARAAQAA